MAKLPSDTLTTIFQLQRRLIKLINEAGETEQIIFVHVWRNTRNPT